MKSMGFSGILAIHALLAAASAHARYPDATCSLVNPPDSPGRVCVKLSDRGNMDCYDIADRELAQRRLREYVRAGVCRPVAQDPRDLPACRMDHEFNSQHVLRVCVAVEGDDRYRACYDDRDRALAQRKLEEYVRGRVCYAGPEATPYPLPYPGPGPVGPSYPASGPVPACTKESSVSTDGVLRTCVHVSDGSLPDACYDAVDRALVDRKIAEYVRAGACVYVPPVPGYAVDPSEPAPNVIPPCRLDRSTPGRVCVGIPMNDAFNACYNELDTRLIQNKLAEYRSRQICY